MTNQSKFLAAIVLGAASGVAVILLLNTDTGKEVLEEMKSAAEKAFRNWKNKVANSIEDIETNV